MSKLNLHELVALLNTELYRLHSAGKSVLLKSNNYRLKLRENELLTLDISINDCQHKWISYFGFSKCEKCSMTKQGHSDTN